MYNITVLYFLIKVSGLLQGWEQIVVMNFCCFLMRGHCVYTSGQIYIYWFIHSRCRKITKTPFKGGGLFQDGNGKGNVRNSGFCLIFFITPLWFQQLFWSFSLLFLLLIFFIKASKTVGLMEVVAAGGWGGVKD